MTRVNGSGKGFGRGAVVLRGRGGVCIEGGYGGISYSDRGV